jgi:hypothetical protein
MHKLLLVTKLMAPQVISWAIEDAEGGEYDPCPPELLVPVGDDPMHQALVESLALQAALYDAVYTTRKAQVDAVIGEVTP